MTEGLLRQLLDHAVNLCVVMDREEAIIYVNRAFEELFGDPDSTLTGKSIFPMLHPDDVASLQLSFGQAFEKPDEKNLTTFRLKHRQGAWRILEASCWAVIDSAPAPRLLVSAHDVTHRVEAQQQLREREAQLNRAQRVAKLGSWELNLTTDELFASPQLFKMYGLAPRESIPFRLLRSQFHPDDVAKINQVMHHAQQTMGSFDFQHRIILKDGVVRMLIIRGETEFYGTDFIMYGTAQDVSDIHAMEVSLRHSERRFRAIFDSMFQLIGLMDPNGTLLEINEAALQFGGVEREEVIGKPFWEGYWWSISDETRATLKESIQQASEGKFVRYNVEIFGAGKQVATLDFSIKPVRDVDGRIIQLIPEGRDITNQIAAEKALRESEAKYRILIENMSEGVIMADREGNIVACNPCAEQILRLPREVILQRKVFDSSWKVIERDGHQLSVEEFTLSNVLKTGDVIDGRVLGIPHEPDGAVTWISINAVPIRDVSPDLPFAAVATFHNITDLIKREKELKRSRQKLRNLASQLHRAQEDERARLAREVHDVLGQATTALRLDIHWLKENGPQENPSFRQHAQQALDQVEDTIKTVRRISHELRPGVLDHFGLAAALEWLAEQYKERCAISFDVVDEAGERLDGMDPDLATALFRIFQEALTNVIKHSEATSVKVKLFVEKKRLYLIVSDDGKGFCDRDIEQTSSLGILNMRERVLPWNGVVTITGTPGEGTRIEVKVPVP